MTLLDQPVSPEVLVNPVPDRALDIADKNEHGDYMPVPVTVHIRPAVPEELAAPVDTGEQLGRFRRVVNALGSVIKRYVRPESDELEVAVAASGAANANTPLMPTNPRYVSVANVLEQNRKPAPAQPKGITSIPLFELTPLARPLIGEALEAEMRAKAAATATAEAKKRTEEARLISVKDVWERLDDTHERVFRATYSLCAEVADLQSKGYDVAFTDPYDREGLPEEQVRQARAHIASLEAVAEDGVGAERFLSDETIKIWNNLKMRAVSLYPLYGAEHLQTLGEGIDPGVYDLPLFQQPDGSFISANEALRQDMAKAGKPELADAVIAHYQAFITQPISDESRLIWGGSLDGRGVRTRAYEAMGQAVAHFADEHGRIDRTDLRLASFACGAAGPISELVGLIQEAGGDVSEANLVDMDPMAIATAVSVMKPIAEKLRVFKQDLTRRDVTEYLEPESIDVADLLGLFEYFPDKLAVSLLKRVKEVMKPGGLIVFGNMVEDREELTFFENVVQWPKLYRRTIGKTFELIEKAGFDLQNVSARTPAREGVYTVYTIRIPGEHEAVQVAA